VKKRRPDYPTTEEMVEVIKRDPNFRLRLSLHGLADSGNPYFAWRAIETCIKHKKQFPDWLVAYLEQCAERMLSDKAKKEGRDLRKILPWVFGFEGKRGPGNMLDPGGNTYKMTFALRFAIRLEDGESPPAARRNACNDVFDGDAADADDKTLRRWLLEEFDLKKQPSSADEWKIVARKRFCLHGEALRELVIRHRTKSRETVP
jgi:hypothetical protein